MAGGQYPPLPIEHIQAAHPRQGRKKLLQALVQLGHAAGALAPARHIGLQAGQHMVDGAQLRHQVVVQHARLLRQVLALACLGLLALMP